MKTRVSILLMAVSLMPCSAHPPAATAAPPVAPPATEIRVLPLPDYSAELPLEPADQSAPRLCLLGTTCEAMDKRPFKSCLLDTRHCDGAPPVTLLVAREKLAKAPSR